MRKLLAIIAAALMLIAFAGPAFAGPATDAEEAVVSTNEENLTDIGQWIGSDITCKIEPYGGPIVQETFYVVGKLYGEDFALGRGTCVSFTDNSYTIHNTTKVQWLNTGVTPHRWQDVAGCSNTKDADAVKGVAESTFNLVTCTYNHGEPDPYLDAYHRARVCITNTLDAVPRCLNSEPWYMRRG